MVAKKKAVKKKAKPRAPRAPRASAASAATALATAALKRAQTRSVMEDVKSRYAAKYGKAPSEAMARSIMAAIAAGIPIDATFRDPDPIVVAPPTQTQVPLVAINSGPMGQQRPPSVPAALVQRVGPPAPPRMPPRPTTQAQQAAALAAAVPQGSLGPLQRAVRAQLAPGQAAALAAAVQPGALGPLQRAVRAQANRDDVYTALPITQANRDDVYTALPITQADRDDVYLAFPPEPQEQAPPLPPPLPAPPLTQADRDAAFLKRRRETRARRDEVMTAERADEANRRLAAIQQQLNTQGALEVGQDDPILQRGRQQVAAAAAAAQTAEERNRAIANRRFEAALRGQTRPTVLIQDPVSAETSASTARLQQRDRDLTVLREERDSAVRAMQEQARAQEQARQPQPTRKRKADDDLLSNLMKNLKIAPDFPPITLDQLDQSQAWLAGPLGENPVIPQAPPGMRVKMRMSRSGPRPVIRNGQVQFEPEPILLPNAPVPIPPPMPAPPRTQAELDAAYREAIRARRNRPAPPPPVDERAEFQARMAAHEAGLQAARERLAAQGAAAYQQQMAARNRQEETGDVTMNFGPDPREVVVPAEGEVGTFDDLGEGSKIQSIAFPIGEWSSASALRWLRSHGFVPQKKGEAKANYLRYRIRAPRFSNYITRAVQSKGRKIHLIIGV